MNNWPTQFPRLNELYMRSDRSHPDNYFNLLTPQMGYSLWQNLFKRWEENLEHLDTTTWEQLVAKAAPYVCFKDERRKWSKLWETLNEAFGCFLLLERGYPTIRFIDTGSKKSPDL